MEFGLVLFRDYPPNADFLIRLSSFTRDPTVFNTWLDKVEFNMGGYSSNPIAEALAAAYEASNGRKVSGQRFFILLTNSSPYSNPTVHARRKGDCYEQAQFLGEAGICLSVIAPRHIKELTDIYQRAKLPSSSANALSTNVKNSEGHWVLLRGLKMTSTATPTIPAAGSGLPTSATTASTAMPNAAVSPTAVAHSPSPPSVSSQHATTPNVMYSMSPPGLTASSSPGQANTIVGPTPLSLSSPAGLDMMTTPPQLLHQQQPSMSSMMMTTTAATNSSSPPIASSSVSPSLATTGITSAATKGGMTMVPPAAASNQASILPKPLPQSPLSSGGATNINISGGMPNMSPLATSRPPMKKAKTEPGSPTPATAGAMGLSMPSPSSYSTPVGGTTMANTSMSPSFTTMSSPSAAASSGTTATYPHTAYHSGSPLGSAALSSNTASLNKNLSSNAITSPYTTPTSSTIPTAIAPSSSPMNNNAPTRAPPITTTAGQRFPPQYSSSLATSTQNKMPTTTPASAPQQQPTYINLTDSGGSLPHPSPTTSTTAQVSNISNTSNASTSTNATSSQNVAYTLQPRTVSPVTPAVTPVKSSIPPMWQGTFAWSQNSRQVVTLCGLIAYPHPNRANDIAAYGVGEWPTQLVGTSLMPSREAIQLHKNALIVTFDLVFKTATSNISTLPYASFNKNLTQNNCAVVANISATKVMLIFPHKEKLLGLLIPRAARPVATNATPLQRRPIAATPTGGAAAPTTNPLSTSANVLNSSDHPPTGGGVTATTTTSNMSYMTSPTVTNATAGAYRGGGFPVAVPAKAGGGAGMNTSNLQAAPPSAMPTGNYTYQQPSQQQVPQQQPQQQSYHQMSGRMVSGGGQQPIQPVAGQVPLSQHQHQHQYALQQQQLQLHQQLLQQQQNNHQMPNGGTAAPSASNFMTASPQNLRAASNGGRQ
ncbi:Mediator of RNA polymerase II transcription subunit 25 [Balamuthia mandrillaris]